MKIKLLILLLFFIALINKINAQPEILWGKCFGGTESDGFIDAKATSDGGYICLGSSTSDDFDLESVCCNQGGFDFWVVKLDSEYNIIWQKLFGTEIGLDVPNSIFINTDGTYSIFGVAEGDTGDCTCNHSSSQDIWMVLINNTGGIIDQKCYGGSSFEILNNVAKCEDGGYIIGAYSGSSDGDVGIHYGSDFSSDAFIIKINEAGEIQWTKTIGGTGYDGAWVAGISQNQCLISIITSSTDHDLAGFVPVGETAGRLLIKTSADGNILKQQFDRSYDHLFELFTPYEFKSNNYLILGHNQIDTGLFWGNKGSSDATIALFDSNLVLMNVFQFGGSKIDVFERLHRLNDSTFYFTGFSYSSDFDTQGGHGEEEDAFIVKTDTLFNKIWSKSLGASGGDRCTNLFPSDTNILLIGQSTVYTGDDGDIIGAHFDPLLGANGEGWLIITEDLLTTIDTLFSDVIVDIFPNPAQDLIIIKITNSVAPEYYLDVISITGEIVLQAQLAVNVFNEVDSHNLPSGSYLFKISDNKLNILTKKIILQ